MAERIQNLYELKVHQAAFNHANAGTKMISLSEPALGEIEKKVLCDVIDSKWITMGERVAQFERAFAEFHGVESVVAVNSCTAALHLSLAGLGIGIGDEVLVPSLTFVATVNAVLYVGAIPVFVDISRPNLPHLSPVDAETKISDRTKAIIIMHYGGYLEPVSEWRSFCDSHNIKLIEDAAHSPGVSGVGRKSDATAFSFFTNKNMTTAEGGMIFASSDPVLDRIRTMRSHGMTTVTLDRYRGHAFSYDVTTLGYNYRMDELRASMGIVQLQRLPQWKAKRIELSAVYRKMIAEMLPNLDIPFGSDHPTGAHLMPVILPEGIDRQKVMKNMLEAGIQTSIHYPPIHWFSYHKNRFPGISLPHTESYFKGTLSLPLHPGLSEKDVRHVVISLADAIGK
jgi:dTDP-4-amino-4,6-dideoxygalactose transaminase